MQLKHLNILDTVPAIRPPSLIGSNGSAGPKAAPPSRWSSASSNLAGDGDGIRQLPICVVSRLRCTIESLAFTKVPSVVGALAT